MGCTIFFCKCSEKFKTYEEIQDHLIRDHGCEVNYKKFYKEKKNKTIAIKFYWGLQCKCGRTFTSSLCNADTKISFSGIAITKLYKLKCMHCNRFALFRDYENIMKYIRQRVKLKLIFWSNVSKLSNFDSYSEKKKLKDHKQELCEKCIKLGEYCGNIVTKI